MYIVDSEQFEIKTKSVMQYQTEAERELVHRHSDLTQIALGTNTENRTSGVPQGCVRPFHSVYMFRNM